MRTKKLTINSETTAYLLYGKLSNSTITALIIGRLLITNHFGNISKLFFPIKGLTQDNAGGKGFKKRMTILRKLLMIFSPVLFQI